MKYPLTAEAKANAKEIGEIATAEFSGIMAQLVKMGMVDTNLPKVFSGQFFPLREIDAQRSGNAVKFASARLRNGVAESLTYSVQCLQGGTTGYADTLTIVGTSEIKIKPTVFLPNGEPDLNSSKNYDICHLSTYTKSVVVESNGVTKVMRGVIGSLADHDARTIAKLLCELREKDQTAERMTRQVADPRAHSFTADNWFHPKDNGRNWKNGGQQIGTVGKIVTR
jgi:hypothetical protein